MVVVSEQLQLENYVEQLITMIKRTMTKPVLAAMSTAANTTSNRTDFNDTLVCKSS